MRFARVLREGWSALKVSPAVQRALVGAGFAEPTALQSTAVPQLLSLGAPAAVLGAETGSGKTLGEPRRKLGEMQGAQSAGRPGYRGERRRKAKGKTSVR